MEFEDDLHVEQPSKTRRKKEMHALQATGARLIDFSESQLDQLPLSEKLRNAIREFRRLPNSHGARRRQLQFIGRLMRDYQLEEIEEAINRLSQPARESAADRQILDSGCDQVLLEGDTGITRLIEEYQQLERQALRKFFLDYQKAERNDAVQELEQIRNELRRHLRKALF